MDDKSFLGQLHPDEIEALYRSYQSGEEMDASWKYFFRGFELAQTHFGDSFHSEHITKEFDVINLIDSYRKRGHLFTKTNPVRSRRKYFPTLDIENFNLTETDLETEFDAGKLIGLGKSKLKDIIVALQKTYCSNIGAEYMFIRQPEITQWLKDRMETSQNQPEFSDDERRHIFWHLNHAVGFEQFIHKKFVGQKRFSLEGGESLIPALDAVIEKGAELGVEEFVIGMSHRGRLNVLSNILKKDYHLIFEEFTAKKYDTGTLLGDVKYHLGYSNKIKTHINSEVELHLLPNPSHLELVGPVVEGVSRAKLDNKFSGDENKLVPIIIHGDAAISGQGVVYETVQMSQLDGYRTGGTIHLVVNNQIGFTTNYLDGRSSTYSTDVAKVIKAPIFHVNGDDPEALIYVIRLAMEYRQIFHTDVFIDILGYRKYGHNEGDEPRFTQPVLYSAISKHPSVREIYADILQRSGIMKADEIKAEMNEFQDKLDEELQLAKQMDAAQIHEFLPAVWDAFSAQHPPKLSKQSIFDLTDTLTTLPKDKLFLSKVEKLVAQRRVMVEDGKIDWGMAELLAYASLVNENIPVRLSGQDSVRGTFSHRHTAFYIQDSRESFNPLKHISKTQAQFNVFNSLLSELAVVGFEYGYALASPKALTIWEAQFGDFSNMAQPIYDQYISSAQAKWGLHNGLVLFLPHGYEGQGPEHSSARIERYLELAVNDNMQIIYPTRPEQVFHALREHVYQDFQHPMIVFTPKSILRHPKAVCAVEDLMDGKFEAFIDINNPNPEEVTELVVTTGKLYYQVMQKRDEMDAGHIAVVSLEQLFPFPAKQFEELLTKYDNAKLRIFAQDEPANMGAYKSICRYLGDLEFELVARPESASPAPGLYEQHLKQEEKILSKIFRQCDCEWNHTLCDMHCVNYQKH
jgi:2-oxoglutarate dehydrogenase E1 component